MSTAIGYTTRLALEPRGDVDSLEGALEIGMFQAAHDIVRSMTRRAFFTGTPWEESVGYARAVQVGPHIHVTGTLAADSAGRLIGGNDPYEQTVAAIRKIEGVLEEAGATLAHVVRTRMYVTNLDDAAEIGRAHKLFFGDIRPCATMIEVSRLFIPDARIEIEVDAYID
jgi:enamine deaminase RidA (YjgF/YER057c/UK114 family)